MYKFKWILRLSDLSDQLLKPVKADFLDMRKNWCVCIYVNWIILGKPDSEFSSVQPQLERCFPFCLRSQYCLSEDLLLRSLQYTCYFYSSGKCRYNCYLYYSGFYCICGIVRPSDNSMSYNSYLRQLLNLQEMCGWLRGLLSNCRDCSTLGGRPRFIRVTIKIATDFEVAQESLE